MRRYFTIFRLAVARTLVYRGASIVFLLMSFANTFLNISIWAVAYKNPNFKSSIGFPAFITYFLLALLFVQLANSFTAGVIAEEHIKRGELSIYLLKPFPYFLYMMLLEIPWRLQQFILSLPAVFVLWYLFKDIIRLSPVHIVFAFGIIILSYLLSFLIQIIFAMFTFWLGDFHGTGSLLEIMWILFSGIGVPIFFFPPLLLKISFFLPFQYLVYFPVGVASNRLDFPTTVIGISVICTWMLLLFFFSQKIWHTGLKRFTGEVI
jgi:ABC-2 type transport system permease protein